MTRFVIAGGLYGDHLPSGEFCVTVPGVHCTTHLGLVALPPGETFGPTFPRCTRVEGFRFTGQAHDTENPAAWEWDSLNLTAAGSGWDSYPPPACGVSAVIYDNDGVLHRSDCGPGVGSQGYRYVTPDNVIISGDATYSIDLGAGRKLFEYTDVGGLLIGQAAYDGGGAQVWDQENEALLQLEFGSCRFVNAHRLGDVVSLAFTRPEGVVLMLTSMAELRALPVAVPQEPPDPGPEPPEPELPNPEPPEPEPAPEPVEEEGELTVDIYDKGDAIVIQSTVAGVKPEDLDAKIYFRGLYV